MLVTLGRAVSIRIDGLDVHEETVRNAILIIEPNNGGDLKIESGGVRRVEQIKSKSTGGTWSLNSVINSVLFDLYLAVPDNFTQKSEFVFTTEGRIGDWNDTKSFFESLDSIPAGSFNVSDLDNSPRHKLDGKSLGDQGLFKHICKILTSRKRFKNEDEDLTHQKVKFLLSNFSFPPAVKLEKLTTDINQFLIGHVEFLDPIEVKSKRRELCNIILEAGAAGNASLSAESILRKANLPLWSFRNLERLSQRMNRRLKNRIQVDQYVEHLDVRNAPKIERPVTVLRGASGHGKTWSLSRLALEQSRIGKLVTWISFHRDGHDPLQMASDEIWKYGLDRAHSLTLDRIASHRKSVLGNEQHDPWCLVCIDGVSNRELQAIVRQDWQSWGIDVAVTTSNDLPGDLGENPSVNLIPVDNFSVAQLHEYMSRRGKKWAETPDDVRRLILWPILAKLYCDLEHSGGVDGLATEYELMECFWNQIPQDIDVGATRKIASLILSGHPSPWPIESLVIDRGIPTDSIERLKLAGWLRSIGDGQVGFWHYRLQSWALAKSLASEFLGGSRDLESLCRETKNCADNYRQHGHFNVGYTPIDVLWLLLNSSRRDDNEYWRVLQSLELYAGASSDDAWLYEQNVPCLGKKAIPMLFDRARNIKQETDSSLVERIYSAIHQISPSVTKDIEKAAAEFLKSDNSTHVEFGLLLAIGYPGVVEPDVLWQAFCGVLDNDKDSPNERELRILGPKALNAVCSIRLDWLEAMLVNESEHSPYLVAALGSNETKAAKQIWFRTKDQLKQNPANRFAIISCVRNFREKEELETLESWLGNEVDARYVQTVETMVCLCPERVLEILPSLTQLKPTCWNWEASTTSGLIASLPAQDVNRVLKELLANDPDSFHRFFFHVGDQLDTEAASLLIHWLDERLALQQLNEDNQSRLFEPLSLVANLRGQNAIEAFHSFQGSLLESRLIKFAASRADHLAMAHDSQFEDAKTILKKISGQGVLHLANRLLASPSLHAQRDGSQLALIQANEQTAKLLEKVATSEAKWLGSPAGSEFAYLQWEATEALIANEFNAEFVRALLKLGDPIPNDVSELRYKQEPISTDDLRPALDLVASNVEQSNKAILVIGFSGQSEHLDTIEAKLLDSQYDSKEAFCCLLAYKELAQHSEPILERLYEQYESGHYKHLVLAILDRCDDSTPAHYLQLLPREKFDHLDLNVLRYLAKHDETKNQVRDLVRKYILFSDNLDPFSGRLVDKLIDPDVEDEQELLWEHSAAPSDSWFNGNKANAIERLAMIDESAAYAIACQELNGGHRLAHRMHAVLLKLRLTEAVEELFRFVESSTDKGILRSVGLALRRHCDTSQVRSRMEESLDCLLYTSPSPRDLSTSRMPSSA